MFTQRSIFWASALVAGLALAVPSVVHAAEKTKVRHMTGTVVSVNEQAKTLTVKHLVKGKTLEQTFEAEKDAADTLSQFKPGERVRIAYVERDGHWMAQSVTPAAHAEKK